MNPTDSTLRTMLRDYGYRVEGRSVIRCGIRGWTSDEVLPWKCRGLLEAAEMLCPIIREDDFTRRLVAIHQLAS